jgi:CheY-like chemotaxis protein
MSTDPQKRVLVVDDDATICELLSSVLGKPVSGVAESPDVIRLWSAAACRRLEGGAKASHSEGASLSILHCKWSLWDNPPTSSE